MNQRLQVTIGNSIAGGGSEASYIANSRNVLKRFVSCYTSYFHLEEEVLHDACIWSVMLYDSETWSVKGEDLIARLHQKYEQALLDGKCQF